MRLLLMFLNEYIIYPIVNKESLNPILRVFSDEGFISIRSKRILRIEIMTATVNIKISTLGPVIYVLIYNVTEYNKCCQFIVIT